MRLYLTRVTYNSNKTDKLMALEIKTLVFKGVASNMHSLCQVTGWSYVDSSEMFETRLIPRPYFDTN